MFYKPKGDYNLTVRFKIDNHATQNLTFDLSGEFDALGTEFILGTSYLGLNIATPTVSQSVDGYGHGFSIDILQAGVDQEAEIYGFAVEYEKAGDRQESPELG